MLNHTLAKSIQDVSWSSFVNMIEYKSVWRGREVKRIGRFEPSSKMCSCCGWKDETQTLSDRIFKCLKCGLKIDRDFNAAKNILEFSREELTRINASGDKSIDNRGKKKKSSENANVFS